MEIWEINKFRPICFGFGEEHLVWNSAFCSH